MSKNKKVYYLQEDRLINKQTSFSILRAVIHVIDRNGIIKESRFTEFGKDLFAGKFCLN
jgi:hypothetical protein